MEGHTFEHFCAKVLARNGFTNVNVTPGSGDNGGDILASKPDITGSITYVIQCKRYSDNVGVKAVQEAYFARSNYGRAYAVVLTNSYFTEQAKTAAKKTGVRLWDRDILKRLVTNAFPADDFPTPEKSNECIFKDSERLNSLEQSEYTEEKPKSNALAQFKYALTALAILGVFFAILIAATWENGNAKPDVSTSQNNGTFKEEPSTEDTKPPEPLPDSGKETFALRQSVYDLLTEFQKGDIDYSTAKDEFYKMLNTPSDEIDNENFPCLFIFHIYFTVPEEYADSELIDTGLKGLNYYLTGIFPEDWD